MELIKREDALEVIKDSELGQEYNEVEKVPSVDAVVVVRCKECKHRETGDSGFEIDICRDATKRTGLPYIFCNKNGLFVPNTFFCADGERREA